jgi:hypothetical protein
MGCFSALAYWGESEYHLMLVRAVARLVTDAILGKQGELRNKG